MKYLFSEIKETVSPDDVDLRSFDLHDTMNEKFWHDGDLDLYVRKSLLVIARDFIDGLGVGNVPVDDVIMTGSLANYNWSEEYSDIDLHIIVDFGKVADDEDLVRRYFDAMRRIWNSKHENLTIYGYPVEVYMQDSDDVLTSTGVYSLLDGKWITEPSKEEIGNDNLDEDSVRKEVSDFMNEIDTLSDELDNARDSGDADTFSDIYDRAGEIIERITDRRKKCLGKKDSKEMSEGNLVFKSLRRNGYIGKVFDIRRDSYDLANSL